MPTDAPATPRRYANDYWTREQWGPFVAFLRKPSKRLPAQVKVYRVRAGVITSCHAFIGHGRTLASAREHARRAINAYAATIPKRIEALKLELDEIRNFVGPV